MRKKQAILMYWLIRRLGVLIEDLSCVALSDSLLLLIISTPRAQRAAAPHALRTKWTRHDDLLVPEHFQRGAHL